MTSIKQSLGFLAIIFVSASCSQPERITIDEDPKASASEDTSQTTQSEATFQQLNIGEYSPIRSLDPLFAENTANMRAIQLVYEGLVRLDEEGEVTPGLAYNWTVSDDSLRYEFSLRSEVFYHDNQVFSTGTGRRLISEDVQFVFERMAKMNVPPQHAQFFMNIQGFDPYFQEQRYVYNPQNREIEGISGIETPDDNTVVFHLKEKDSNFIRKLATPAAVIYPREAVTGLSSITPVGTGPFTFSQVTSDSTLVFSKFQEYYAADQVSLNRVDIQLNASENFLGKGMDSGDLHLLPQLGPKLLVNLIDENGQLKSEYTGKYNLQIPGGLTKYVMRHNPSSKIPAPAARQVTEYIATDSISYFEQFPNKLVQPDTTFTMSQDTVTNQQEIYSMYSESPYVQTFLGNLSTELADQGMSLQMINIKAPTENTALLFTTDYPLVSGSQWNNYDKLFSFNVQHVTLQHPSIEGLSYNQYPWWLDLRGVTISPTDSL